MGLSDTLSYFCFHKNVAHGAQWYVSMATLEGNVHLMIVLSIKTASVIVP